MSMNSNSDAASLVKERDDQYEALAWQMFEEMLGWVQLNEYTDNQNTYVMFFFFYQ